MATKVSYFSNTGGNWQDVRYLLRRAQRIILVPKYGSDQEENTIATRAGVTKAALQALFDDHDLKDRYYPLPSFKNVTDERAESNFFEYDDGEKEFLREGVRHFEGHIKAADGGAKLKKYLNDWRGAEFGIYIIDEDGNFAFMLDDDGTIVKPLPLAGGSFDIRVMPATADGVFMLNVSFDFHPDLDDGDIDYIPKKDLDFNGLSDEDIYGLWDVTIEEVSNTLTTIVATVKTDYDTAVTGLVLADFYLYNTTDSAEVVPSGVVETAGTPGEYTFTFAEQTASDAYELRVNKSRYDYNDTLTGTLTA